MKNRLRGVEKKWSYLSRSSFSSFEYVHSQAWITLCVMCSIAEDAVQVGAAYHRRSAQLDDWGNSCITVPIPISEKLMKCLRRLESKVERRSCSCQAVC